MALPAPSDTQRTNWALAGTVIGCLLLVMYLLAFFVRPANLTLQKEHRLRIKPGVAAFSSGSSLTDGPNSTDTYTSSAQANLTVLKLSLLGKLQPLFGSSDTSKLWPILAPIITCPDDRPLSRYGEAGDGGKLLCKVPQNLHRSCLIYSLGSNGDFSFEMAMLKETGCDIHTFDCTYNGTSKDPRHYYHKWCIGSERKPDFRTWANITAELGHSTVDVLKMDIEGFEYSVLGSFKPEDPLPLDISMELHMSAGSENWATSNVEAAVAIYHLAELGYAAYSQEVNPIAPGCCCEFSFRRLV